jgi:hypothetical protein
MQRDYEGAVIEVRGNIGEWATIETKRRENLSKNAYTNKEIKK